MAKSSVEVQDDTAVGLVVARIKEMFEQGNLKTGSTLPSERELCELCSASRATAS